MATAITNPMTGLRDVQEQPIFPVSGDRPVEPSPVAPAPKQQQGFNFNQDQLATIYKHKPNRAIELGYVAPTSSVEIGAEDLGTPSAAAGTVQQGGGALSDSLNTVSTTQTGTTAAEPSQKDMVMQSVNQLFGEMQSFDPAAIKEAAGVYAQQEIVNRLSEGYDQAIVEQRRTIQEMRTNPEGKLRGALDADISEYKYQSDQNLADKAMALHYARQDYNGMYEIAQDAIDAQREQFQYKRQFLMDTFNMLQNDLTASEKLAFQSELSIREKTQMDLIESKNNALQAAQANNAPPEVVSAIKNAQNSAEVWAAAGQYGVDPTLGLARDKFAWEKTKYWNDQAIKDQLESGEATALEALELSTRNDALSTAGQGLTDIQELISNVEGLKQSTGVTALGRFAPFSADKDRFLANAKYIINNQTFKKLAEITENTTLGQISEGELKLVESAASKLGGYAIMEDGELKGFEGSHEDILAAIIELEDAQEAYIEKIKRGAVADDEYLEIERMRTGN